MKWTAEIQSFLHLELWICLQWPLTIRFCTWFIMSVFCCISFQAERSCDIWRTCTDCFKHFKYVACQRNMHVNERRYKNPSYFVSADDTSFLSIRLLLEKSKHHLLNKNWEMQVTISYYYFFSCYFSINITVNSQMKPNKEADVDYVDYSNF